MLLNFLLTECRILHVISTRSEKSLFYFDIIVTTKNEKLFLSSPFTLHDSHINRTEMPVSKHLCFMMITIRNMYLTPLQIISDLT